MGAYLGPKLRAVGRYFDCLELWEKQKSAEQQSNEESISEGNQEKYDIRKADSMQKYQPSRQSKKLPRKEVTFKEEVQVADWRHENQTKDEEISDITQMKPRYASNLNIVRIADLDQYSKDLYGDQQMRIRKPVSHYSKLRDNHSMLQIRPTKYIGDSRLAIDQIVLSENYFIKGQQPQYYGKV